MRQDNAMFWVDASSHPAIWPSPPPIHCMRPTYNVYTMCIYIYINISYTRLHTMHIQAFLWYTHVYTFRRWNLLHAFKSNNPQTLRCTCRGPKTSRSNLAPSTVTSLQSIFFDPIHSTHEKTTPPLNFVEPLVEWKTRVTRSGWKVCREWLKLWGPTKVPENEIQWKPCCTSGTTCATQYLLCEQGFLWRAPSTLYRPAAVASISLPLYIPWIPEKKMERIHQFDAQCVDSTRNIST